MSQLTKDDRDIRISKELSEGEKRAIENRTVKVRQCFESLGIDFRKDDMPTIAVLGSGGGLRAMIALLGTLVELKKQGLLDAVTYLCGVSGSTWCMSSLYNNNDWTEKLQELEKEMCDTLSKKPWDLREASEILIQAAEDELFSLTDIWAAFISCLILKQYDKNKLSQHEDATTKGTNPYPIYAAVEANELKKEHKNSPGTWFEFTPHESGFPGLGAFVCTENLGSKFNDGKLIDICKEKNICYMQGLWGSALGSMEEIKNYIIDFFWRLWEKLVKAIFKRGTDCTCARCQCILLILDLQVQASVGKDSEVIFRELKEVLKGENSNNSYQMCCEMSMTWGSKTQEERMMVCIELIEMKFGETHCCSQSLTMGGSLRRAWDLLCKTFKCIRSWTWGSTNNFLYRCYDPKFADLAGKNVINLLDAGIAINSAYPLLLRPERNVKLILSFDFSDGDPFETISKTVDYCKTNNISFPEIDLPPVEERDNPSDCYIFKGNDGPTVMHFPLFNNKNCPDPGEIKDCRDEFCTFTFTYPEDSVKKLLNKAKMNVSNNKKTIVQEIQKTGPSKKNF